MSRKRLSLNDIVVWIRGAGEIASATAVTLYNVGLKVVLTELPKPLAIRRTVSFSDAMFDRKSNVEGVTAKKSDISNLHLRWIEGMIPIIDDSIKIAQQIKPDIIIDGRMLKSEVNSIKHLSSLSIGLGPGFIAGRTCHCVIETNRGHDLGKIIMKGSASPNTGIPGELGRETVRRVIYANTNGYINWKTDFGKVVNKDDIIGYIDYDHPIVSPLSGIVRGLIHPNVKITKGLKIADVDPRENGVNIHSLSDKARAIARAVLEAILRFLTGSDSFHSTG